MDIRLLLYLVLLTANSHLIFAQESNPKKQKSEQIVKSIYFGGGSYYVTPDQVQGIKDFFDEIENIENYEVLIAGHTDDIGGKEYNEWLSKMRGRSVKNELIEILVPEELIKIKNFGMENPLFDNQKYMGKLRNRRVDIILAPLLF